jgi:hypothetical protein
MASGFQGKSAPTANTWVNIYTIPDTKVASFSINSVNRDSGIASIDMVISTSSTSGGIALSEYIEFNTTLDPAGGQLEKTGLVSDATNGKYIWIRSSNANTSFQVYGYEE